MTNSLPKQLYVAGIGCFDPNLFLDRNVALSLEDTLQKARDNPDQRLFAIREDGPFDFGRVSRNFDPETGGELTAFLEPWKPHIPGTHVVVCGIDYLKRLRLLEIENILDRKDFVPILEDGSLGSSMPHEDFLTLSGRILEEAIRIFDAELRSTRGECITEKGSQSLEVMPIIAHNTSRLLRFAIKEKLRHSDPTKWQEAATLLAKGFPDDLSRIGISTAEEMMAWVDAGIQSILAS